MPRPRREPLDKPKPLIMKLDDWLDAEQNHKLLAEHNEAQEEAGRREGTVFKQGSFQRLSKWFKEEVQTYRDQTFKNALEVSFAPSMYGPCPKPLDELKKVMIKDLRCGQRDIDSYILVKTVNRAATLSSFFMAIVTDENDNLVLLRIAMEAFHSHDVLVLPLDTVLLVKQPRLEYISHKQYEINVHHVSDIMFIAPTDEMIPLAWRKEKYKDVSNWSFDKWLDLGEEASNKFEQGLSLQWCNQAMKRSPPEEDANLIHALRSNGNMSTRRLDAALSDIQKAIVIPNFKEHVLRRMGQILYRRGSYGECIEISRKLRRAFPGYRTDKILMVQAKRRVAEKLHGAYDFWDMQRGASYGQALVLDHASQDMQRGALCSQALLLDNASHTGPVAVRESNLHGRGLFTTKDVKIGELLLCEKAFSYVVEGPNGRVIPFDGPFHPWSRPRVFDTVQVNTETKTIIRGPLLDLALEVITKMHKNPSLRSQITDLYSGNLDGMNPGDDNSVNSFQVMQVISLNGFGSPMTTRSMHLYNGNDKKVMYKYICQGIWPQASYINHSCVCNVRRAFAGDMMIIRAAQDIPAGTELTFWYTVPSQTRVTDTSHWGFECSCVLCVDLRDTPGWMLQARESARSGLWKRIRPNRMGEYDELEKELADFSSLFVTPARVVPWFAAWDLYFEAATMFNKAHEDAHAIRWALEGLKACGFVVEGWEPRGSELRVKKWGVVLEEQIEIWLLLFFCLTRVAPGLAPTAEKYARLTYLLCVGEDASFERTVGRQSGRFWPHT
ncbi:unnamed protein product [Penicillium salamii]|uniref:SET domain-containing protein n=1 Tax=Penicillium salamii TaxID=1612424 RepID=A0A9W4N1S5_9EURO|nr:unnamed protein product [Penicillium salamii]CAG7968989.1 unnamed protein product [Penicillium salamii]CAG8040132.1 unnamed protein product [Penicillium salamii]CAG8066809.1 unnamed protein product [Penicillium salamii]CAG8161478.1 unnamed protein product [Penicillium salamii]